MYLFYYIFSSIHVFPVLVLWTIPDPYMGCLEHSLQLVVLVEVIKRVSL